VIRPSRPLLLGLPQHPDEHRSVRSSSQSISSSAKPHQSRPSTKYTRSHPRIPRPFTLDPGMEWVRSVANRATFRGLGTFSKCRESNLG
jgi:hypothetical protein